MPQTTTREFKGRITLEGADEFINSLQKIERRTTSLDKVVKAFIAVKAAAIAVRPAIDTIRNIGNSIGDILVEGAKFKEIEEGLFVIGANAGLSEQKIRGMVERLEEINTFGTAAVDTIRSLVLSGLLPMVENLEIAGKRGFPAFVEMIKDFAATAQITSREAISRFNRAIVQGDVQMLSNLGIMINLNQAYSEFAQKNDLVAAKLTISQRQQALMDAVVKQHTLTAGVYAETYDTASKNLRSIDDATKSFRETLGASFEPIMRVVTGETLEFVKSLRNLALDILPTAELMFQRMGERLSETFDRLQVALGNLEAGPGIIERLADMFLILVGIMTMVAEKGISAAGALVNGWNAVGAAIGGNAQQASILYQRAMQEIEHFNSLTVDSVLNDWAMAKLGIGNEVDNLASRVTKQTGDVLGSIGGLARGAGQNIQASIDKANKRFRERLADIVLKSRDTIQQLKDDYKEEEQAFKKKEREIRAEADKRIRQLRQNEEIEILKNQIKKAKAINKEAGETTFVNIRELEQELEEKERLRDAEIRTIEENRDEELREERQKNREKLQEIRSGLNKELAFLRKHREDVKTVAKQRRLDAIEELKKQHQEELAQIQKQRGAIGRQITGVGQGIKLTLKEQVTEGILAGLRKVRSDIGFPLVIKGIGERLAKSVLENLGSGVAGALRFKQAANFNKGGTVYAQGGLFQSRGSDTVPAMLTPGEAVMSKKAVENFVQGRAGNTFNFNFGGAMVTDRSKFIQDIKQSVESAINRKNELNLLGVN